ncbi:MAG: histidine triad (HIT) family protein [Candidatus Midichloriaceae bacterium]|jgi:histidine triad (HIT) family protein
MYNQNNIFAKIIKKEIPSEVVLENEYMLIFKDINPAAPIHLIAIPKGEFTSFDDFSENSTQEEMRAFFKGIRNITKKLKIDESGYRLVTNHGKDAIQTVEHFHIHILAGKKLGSIISEDKYHNNEAL